MSEYSREDVIDLFKLVLFNVESDLVHSIKHNKTNYDDHVHQLRALDRLRAGISHQLAEELK